MTITATKTRAWIEVDLSAVRANAQAAQTWAGPGASLLGVVKADAYGHGMLPVARTVVEAGATWLGVATVQEGIDLRQSGLQAPICLLCPFAPDEAAALIEHALTPLVGDVPCLDALACALSAVRASPSRVSASMDASDRDVSEGNTRVRQASRRFAVHLDIDTGIGRAGIQPSEAVSLWRRAARAGLDVTGISTHFADADNADETLTREQEGLFDSALTELEAAGARFRWIHAANSHAITRRYGHQANLVRPGLLLYGLGPAAFPCAPALALKAVVATVRDLPAGHPISYGATHRLTRPSRVATVLIGYGDGYPRRLSNQGQMLIRGQRVPILGRVCMDQTVVDVTDLPDVMPGDEAVCLGAQGEERITALEIADRIDATPHEITTCLTARLPRFCT